MLDYQFPQESTHFRNILYCATFDELVSHLYIQNKWVQCTPILEWVNEEKPELSSCNGGSKHMINLSKEERFNHVTMYVNDRLSIK